MNPYSSYGNKRERAKALLAHYLLLLARDQPQVELHQDCLKEIGDIVDCIIAAAKEEAVTAGDVVPVGLPDTGGRP